MLRPSILFSIGLILSLGQSPLKVDSKSFSVQDFEGSNILQVESRNLPTSAYTENEESFQTSDESDKSALLNNKELRDMLHMGSRQNWDISETKTIDWTKVEQDTKLHFSLEGNQNNNSRAYGKLAFLIVILPICICIRCCRFCSKANTTSEPTTAIIIVTGNDPNCADNVHLITPDNDSDSDSHQQRRDNGISDDKENSFGSDGLPSYNKVMGGQRV